LHLGIFEHPGRSVFSAKHQGWFYSRSERMKGEPVWRILAMAMALWVLLNPAGAIGKEYEHPGTRSVKELFPPEFISGRQYRLRETVFCDGTLNQYTVDSNFGTFEVTGNGALRKLIREIQAISILRQVSGHEAYADSLGKAAEKPLRFGEHLIQDPVDTFHEVSRGVYRTVENAYTSATTKRSPHQDSQAEELLAFSAYKRENAYRLGVDVYSTNPVLQKELSRVGWSSVAGSLSFSAAMMPLGTVGTVVSTSRTGQQVMEALREEPPSALRRINEQKLVDMGVSTLTAKHFLDHPIFSPRHQTVITTSLGALQRVRGKDRFIRFILSAENEASANSFMVVAEILRGYHRQISPLRQITPRSDLVLASAENGYLFIPFPADYGLWTERMDRTLTALVKDRHSSDPNAKFELWVTGTLSPVAREELKRLGILIIENVDQKIELMD
jgi:hypothetical protein